ncbi:MAG: universal stress protein [Polaromonas sp.]|uniref:universal stress protein n=1 Tax=Polaromonas sp. TaxID=1869339 RepID=UPI002734BAA0|nr:universal stress protein [Polaromonas sp.]MDP3799451.1 universal stress protein [Polaromonas sp.]
MNKVIACVDGAAYTANVCDYATWAAQRLAVPLEFLHVLDRHPERAPVTDYSGSIGLGTQESLLQELGALDEKRSTLAQRHGRELLDGLVARAKEAGLAAVESRQRHGSLVEALLDLEAESRLFVLGQHHHAEQGVKLHLDHNVERAIRSVQRPVLVARANYLEPKRFVIAFDGSPTGRKMVATVASSPLLKGLRCDVVMAGETTAEVQNQLAWARTSLLDAGFEVQASIEPGEPETALPNYLKVYSADLLVMGAYGHSRIRQLIVGSTTTTLLRTSPVPVLVHR